MDLSSHQSCMEVPISPHLPQLCLLSVFFSFANMMNERCFSGRPITSQKKFRVACAMFLCSPPLSPTTVGRSPEFLPSPPQLVPPAAPRFWELSAFKGGQHRGGAGGTAGASAAGPGGAECRAGEPLAEWPLCPTLPDARPPSAARICAHCTCLHAELHPGTILGREGTGRRVSKGPGSVIVGKGLRSHLETHGPIPDLEGEDGCLGKIP